MLNNNDLSMATLYSLRDMKRETREKVYKAYNKGRVLDVLTDNIQPVDKEAENVTEEDAAIYTNELTNESDPSPPGHATEEDGGVQRTGT